MPQNHTNRSERVERLIEGKTVEELRRATLQAIDHAYKSAAEVAEMRAIYEGALGNISELTSENQRLRTRVETLERQYARLAATRAWHTAQRMARGARTARQRLTP